MKTVFSLLLTLVSTTVLFAQDNFFTVFEPTPSLTDRYDRRLTPQRAALFEVADREALLRHLQAAPGEGASAAPLRLSLPDPDGGTVQFELTRYRMVSPKMAAAHPELVTAHGVSSDRPGYRVFLDRTVRGFHASVRTPDGAHYYIDPLYFGNDRYYQAYYRTDFVPDPATVYACATEETLATEAPPAGEKLIGDCQLREYDLALACTGEYYAFHTDPMAPNDQDVFAEMVTAINRVNEVFRQDLAITLVIINEEVAGEIELLYDDPLTDPYTNNSGSAMLNENQTTVDNVIGNANYDVGHVFSTGGGGIASLTSPCRTGFKARGVTGLNNPIGDPFYIDYVAHELGHQFGAEHTFNASNGNCGQRNAGTAYEPGSGTTVQAYAGICPQGSKIQLNSDAYFHASSLQQISAYMESGAGAGCATVLNTTNDAPTVDAGADYTIPLNTPFVLTATGTDGDPLTYCWEQFDLGAANDTEPVGDEADGPLFRSLPPTDSPQRYFPNLDAVLAGTSNWESLPLVERDLTFIVTVRDAAGEGYGCTVQDQMTVSARNTGAQYEVVAPNGGEVLPVGTTTTVTWNTGNTESAPVSCALVDILLSTDGGLSFPTVIATTDNDGSYDWDLPTTEGENYRLLIRCSDNIFFDVSDADFVLAAPAFEVEAVSTTLLICEGELPDADYIFNLSSVVGYTGTVNYSLTDAPTGVTATFSPASTTLAAEENQTVSATLSGTEQLTAGTYDFSITVTDGTLTEVIPVTLEVGQSAISVASPQEDATEDLMQGANGENEVTFEFPGIAGATAYTIETTILRNGVVIGGGDFSLDYGVETGGFNLSAILTFPASLQAGDVVQYTIVANDANMSESCPRSFTFGAVLPVEWLAFTARAAGKTAVLDWTVLQDAAHAGFRVERSDSGMDDWRVLTDVPRSGADGRAAYAYTDATVAAGSTYYYRLRQEDVDGRTAYSELRQVTLNGEVPALSIYPNPASEQVTIEGGDAGARFSIYGGLGRLLRSGMLTGGRTTVSVAELPAGVYQLRVGEQLRRIVVR